ncbi:MAG: hypothetical protein ACWA5W_08305 [Phycisphaerales bacterium]
MAKDAVRVVVRIVERPPSTKTTQSSGAYQPPKHPKFKAIATCQVGEKPLSRTAAMPTEAQARESAYNKLATLIAKHGAFPIKGPGVDMPDKQ